jgi:membrane fusion protein (multidrug efflux system)
MDTNGSDQDTQTSPARRRFPNGRLKIRLLLLLVLLVAGAAFCPELIYLLNHESTDDAYLTATIVPVSAEVKGRVVQVAIEDNQLVAAGDLLLALNSQDYRLALESRRQALVTRRAELEKEKAAIDEARKQVDANRAILTEATVRQEFAARDKKRYQAMRDSGAVSGRQYDDANTKWQLAEAARQTAESQLATVEAAVKTLEADALAQQSRIAEAAEAVRRSELDLARTKIRAPLPGRVTHRNVEVGKYVAVGQPLLALVDTGDVWVAANFKENQIDKILPGQKVDLKVDAYPGLKLHGHVDSLQAGTGSAFSLLPPENATGNFVKIVQRIPVKILIDTPPDPAHPLLPGLSVVPSIDLKSPGRPAQLAADSRP